MTFVSLFSPIEIWSHFDQILKIPRGSGNEEEIRNYVISVAKRNNLSFSIDEAGNVIIRKKGISNKPLIVIQTHLDMVNEKNNNVKHDFTRDKIKPKRDNEFLKATNTTLGADNGIGIAMALALIESRNINHGDLEFLFTVDEEVGMSGAKKLKPGFVNGRILLNLDTEDEGCICVGCAGGGSIDLIFGLVFEKPILNKGLEIKLSGLKGGHSGCDIHHGRGNAIKILNKIMKGLDFELNSFVGGNMINAIPRESKAKIAVNDKNRFIKDIYINFNDIKLNFKDIDPGMKLDIKECEVSCVIKKQIKDKLINLIEALPNGVIKMCPDIPNLVQTSSNLSFVKMDKNNIFIHVMVRSSVNSENNAILRRIISISNKFGVNSEKSKVYPGWKPNMNSYILNISRGVYNNIFSKDAKVFAIHAGLECGLIGARYNSMDMISIGPTIENPHSPDERVNINSVGSTYKFLIGILETV